MEKKHYICTRFEFTIQKKRTFMLRTLFSFTPFYVCLFWLITFIIHYRKCDTAKRILTWFLCTCVVLYFCHALYFTIGLPHPMECL